MIVQLEKEFAMYREEGTQMNFFGVTFTAKTKKITGGKNKGSVESIWTAKLPAAQGKAMVEACRCVEAVAEDSDDKD